MSRATLPRDGAALEGWPSRALGFALDGTSDEASLFYRQRDEARYRGIGRFVHEEA